MLQKRGFTLLELIIVVIVIGILASIALPRYLDTVEKSKFATAKHTLGELRNQQISYYAQYGNYTDTETNLDIALPVTADWTYTAEAPTSTAVTGIVAKADRSTGNYLDCDMQISVDGNISISNILGTNCANMGL